jgi:hypothetical protein
MMDIQTFFKNQRIVHLSMVGMSLIFSIIMYFFSSTIPEAEWLKKYSEYLQFLLPGVLLMFALNALNIRKSRLAALQDLADTNKILQEYSSLQIRTYAMIEMPVFLGIIAYTLLHNPWFFLNVVLGIIFFAILYPKPSHLPENMQF